MVKVTWQCEDSVGEKKKKKTLVFPYTFFKITGNYLSSISELQL